MIKRFSDRQTRELYETGKCERFPPVIWKKALRRLEYVDLAGRLEDLRTPPSNRLHKPESDPGGRYSISVDERWRVCFRFSAGNAYDVELAEHGRAREKMSFPNKGRRAIRPTHPGAMLREDFLPDYGLTVSNFARALRVSRQSVSELLRERRAMSPDMALRLSILFCTSMDFWLNAQRAVDLWDAARTNREEIRSISPLNAPARPGR